MTEVNASNTNIEALAVIAPESLGGIFPYFFENSQKDSDSSNHNTLSKKQWRLWLVGVIPRFCGAPLKAEIFGRGHGDFRPLKGGQLKVFRRSFQRFFCRAPRGKETWLMTKLHSQGTYLPGFMGSGAVIYCFLGFIDIIWSPVCKKVIRALMVNIQKITARFRIFLLSQCRLAA